jgi:hypothetical protein
VDHQVVVTGLTRAAVEAVAVAAPVCWQFMQIQFHEEDRPLRMLFKRMVVTVVLAVPVQQQARIKAAEEAEVVEVADGYISPTILFLDLLQLMLFSLRVEPEELEELFLELESAELAELADLAVEFLYKKSILQLVPFQQVLRELLVLLRAE